MATVNGTQRGTSLPLFIIIALLSFLGKHTECLFSEIIDI